MHDHVLVGFYYLKIEIIMDSYCEICDVNIQRNIDNYNNGRIYQVMADALWYSMTK